MKKSEINKQIPKVLIPMIRDTFPEIVQSEIGYVKEELLIEDLEDYAFYESGLSADGCLENLDDYARKAIKKYGRILLEKQKEQIKILEEIIKKYETIPIQRRLRKTDISTSVVRLKDRAVFTKNDYNQKFYHHIPEGNILEHYTFEEVQKFIDHGLFIVLKYSENVDTVNETLDESINKSKII